MKLLMAASEMEPFARTGGLGEVIEALPAEVQRLGHDASVVLPFYRSVRKRFGNEIKPTGVKTQISIGHGDHEIEIFECAAPNGVQVFFVQCDEFYDRDGLYGIGGIPFSDNAERFIAFSQAIVELARRLTPPIDLLHLHDWQTALTALLVKDQKLPFATVLTIHNLAFQGSFSATQFALTNLPPGYFAPSGLEFFGTMNLLKGGILFADALTTVSERYALEIQTPEHGCGLDGVLRTRAPKLSGVLSGVDDAIWNPAKDQLIPKRYRAAALSGKKICRASLLKELGLLKSPKGPVVAMIARLSEQKGLDIFLPILDQLLSGDVRAIVLGQGDAAYERELLIASRRHRGRFAFRNSFDEPLSHLIYAGADLVLIPSHSEPRGLAAMYSLKYGTVPVAHACGGLHEILRDFDPATDEGNAFLFYAYSTEALWDAIGRARALYADATHWQKLVRNALSTDFSWRRTAARYVEIYESVVRGRVDDGSARH